MGVSLIGRQVVVGFRKAAAWHTALAVGANHGIIPRAEGVTPTIEDLPDEGIGIFWPTTSDRGKVAVTGSIPFDLRWETLDTLIALAMGTAGVPVVDGTLAFRHTWDMKDNLVGLFGTLALLKKSDTVWEYPSLKIRGFTMRAAKEALAGIEFNVIGDTLELASAINTVGTIAAVTPRTTEKRVVLDKNAYFRVNARDGAALASGNAFPIDNFTLTFERMMEGLYLIDGGVGVNEPNETVPARITLEMMAAEYNDAVGTLLAAAWATPRTPQKGELYFQGPDIEVGKPYFARISFPNLTLTSPPEAPVRNQGRIPVGVRFTARAAAVAPAGMTGITKPFRISWQNSLNVDALA